MLVELCVIRGPFEALVAIGAFHRVLDAETARSRRSVRGEPARRTGKRLGKVAR